MRRRRCKAVNRIRPSVLAGIVAFIAIDLVSRGRSTPYNNYVLLAQAFAHGHVAIDWPGAYIDALPYNGVHYVIEAPLPAILLLPFVALFGTANQTLLSVVLGAIAIGAAWELGERLEIPRAHLIWIAAFFLAGTDLLWCAMLGDVWFIAHVAAACFTMLALVELSGKRRGWLVAIFAACAFESRFSLVLALPVYAYMLGNRRALISFGGVLAAAAVVWTGYNLARFGTWYDIGYTLWYHQDQAGLPYGSPFKLQYLPYQLWSFFVSAPDRLQTFPWLRPTMNGVALTWTSPALVLAFFASRPRRWIVTMWILAVVAAAPDFVYYVNGFAQFGMRHALDFEPFLVVLMMLAVREKMPRWAYALIAYSIATGFWGCWFWNVYVRTG